MPHVSHSEFLEWTIFIFIHLSKCRVSNKPLDCKPMKKKDLPQMLRVWSVAWPSHTRAHYPTGHRIQDNIVLFGWFGSGVWSVTSETKNWSHIRSVGKSGKHLRWTPIGQIAAPQLLSKWYYRACDETLVVKCPVLTMLPGRDDSTGFPTSHC